MADFIWNTVVSYLILFVLLSFSLSFYIKDQSYRFYALYNLFLALYVFTKNEWFYSFLDVHFNVDFSNENIILIQNYFNWYIQVIFYSLYFMFAIYFLDLDTVQERTFKRIKEMLFYAFLISSLFMAICVLQDKYHWFHSYFVYIFVPFLIGLFVYALPKALKHSNNHKYFLLIGIFSYTTFAIIALIKSIIAQNENNLHANAIQFFFIGIIIEGIFFSIGLAYKMKLINDERIKSKNAIIQEEHKREISNLQALIEGEEKERNRLAQELHDGLNGDLSAIKFQLASIAEVDLSVASKAIVDKAVEHIDYSCQQVRNISHNLSPLAILDFGLITSIKNYCLKLESIHPIQIDFQYFGADLPLSKNIETIIYRIVQELVTNIIKHAQATQALVHINTNENNMFITVEDNGKGFEKTTKHLGIGMRNIASRITFLNANLEEEHTKRGTSFTINIDLKNIPTV